MSDTLTKIVDDKRRHVDACKRRVSQGECEKRAKAADLKQGAELAAAAIDSGKAKKALETLVRICA